MGLERQQGNQFSHLGERMWPWTRMFPWRLERSENLAIKKLFGDEEATGIGE